MKEWEVGSIELKVLSNFICLFSQKIISIIHPASSLGPTNQSAQTPKLIFNSITFNFKGFEFDEYIHP